MFARFKHDDRAVSEVVSYLLGFTMSFLLLIVSLAAFTLVSQGAADRATEVQFRDVAGRVASGVLQAIDVGRERAGSIGTADSDTVVFTDLLPVPARVRGNFYTVTLDATHVLVESTDGRLSARANVLALVPPVCTASAAVCQLSGTAQSHDARVLIRYEFMPGGPSADCPFSPLNCIRLE